MSIRDMVARHSDFNETKDFIPTPPYATRVLFEYVAPRLQDTYEKTAWDPACGAGHMCEVFKEYGYLQVLGSDLYDHGYSHFFELDFSRPDVPQKAHDVITNPPYALLDKFIKNGIASAKRSLSLLVRIQALEGQRRFNSIYENFPPDVVAVFSDRIPFKTGEVVKKASKMFTHCWMHWDLETRRIDGFKGTELKWIEPTAQRLLEKAEDYAS